MITNEQFYHREAYVFFVIAAYALFRLFWDNHRDSQECPKCHERTLSKVIKERVPGKLIDQHGQVIMIGAVEVKKRTCSNCGPVLVKKLWGGALYSDIRLWERAYR